MPGELQLMKTVVRIIAIILMAIGLALSDIVNLLSRLFTRQS